MHIIGSRTSSSLEFIKAVSPKIALIGVGENNKFGHPDSIVIDRLQKNGVKVYRTDLDGEIKIEVYESGKLQIKSYLNR